MALSKLILTNKNKNAAVQRRSCLQYDDLIYFASD